MLPQNRQVMLSLMKYGCRVYLLGSRGRSYTFVNGLDVASVMYIPTNEAVAYTVRDAMRNSSGVDTFYISFPNATREKRLLKVKDLTFEGEFCGLVKIFDPSGSNIWWYTIRFPFNNAAIRVIRILEPEIIPLLDQLYVFDVDWRVTGWK